VRALSRMPRGACGRRRHGCTNVVAALWRLWAPRVSWLRSDSACAAPTGPPWRRR
jgi:hypothetical protein